MFEQLVKISHVTPSGKMLSGIGRLNVTIRDSNNVPVQYACVLNGEYVVIPSENAHLYVHSDSSNAKYQIGGYVQTDESCSCVGFRFNADCKHLMLIRAYKRDGWNGQIRRNDGPP
jgi:hypothetical protein